jgi:sigma-B regulation protein RsbU (phosphoserine phosphatase)
VQETKPVPVEFLLYQPNTPPVRYALTEGIVTLGRASECTIPIKDRFLSRKHAEITRQGGAWVLRDCGSANGTFVNGVRVFSDVPLRPGDRITLGDAEIVFRQDEATTDHSFAVEDSLLATNMAIPVRDVVEQDLKSDHGAERLQILNSLAIELMEDRPMNDLFDFILDRVMTLVHPSRAAIALLSDDKKSFLTVKVHRRDTADLAELTISRTLLSEVVEEKKVISFFDLTDNDKLAQAKSIIGQSIRSAICAPLMTQDVVIGVLYADFLVTQKRIPEEDLRLMAQIARFAAVKVETTRLREESLAKQRIEEELKMTYVIQSRLLPSAPPTVAGYSFAGVNKPCRTVSGDYFDYVVKPDGRIYFVIADVSGKGIVAALVMSSLATAFNIYTEDDPTPAELLERLNHTLQPKLSPTKFVTIFTGIVDPPTGVIHFANAGHTPPIWIHKDGVSELKSTDLVVGLIANVKYRDQSITLESGDSMVLFTDGIIEAESEEGVELGSEATCALLLGMHETSAAHLVKHLEDAVLAHVGSRPLGDDVTIVAVTRH